MLFSLITKSIRLALSIKAAFIFILYTFAVIVLSFFLLHSIIDESQESLYQERLEKIAVKLRFKNETLVRTGLQEVYGSVFMDEAIREIEGEYYAESNETAPFLIDNEGYVLLHPELARGYKLSGFYDFPENSECEEICQWYSRHKGGRRAWFISLYFPEWEWTIIFEVPLHVKYRDVMSYMYLLIPLSILFLIITYWLVYGTIKKTIHPLQILTKASNAMAAGDLSHEIPYISGEDEIAQLAESFQNMRNIIYSNLEELQEEIEIRTAAEKSRNEALKALEEKEENLRVTLNSIADAVVVVDSESFITLMNPVAERMSGISLDLAKGQSFTEVFKLRGFKSYTGQGQTTLEKNNGEDLPIEYSGSSLGLSNDQQTGSVLVIRDLSDRNKMEQIIRQSQKMEAVGQLAGGIAHDFNNMLTGVLGAAELLKSLVKDDPSLLYLNLITQSAKRASGLTSQLLSFSRKKKLEKKVINISSLIRDSVDLLSKTIVKSVDVQSSIDDSSLHVMADASLLQSALINLGINASHAMPNGGQLHFKAVQTRIDETFCAQSSFDLEPGPYVELSVKDNGTGIAPEHLEHIFEPFFTTKDPGKGTGLGLAAVFGTIQEHHGSISVKSQIGEGTEFTLLIPLFNGISKDDERIGTVKGEGLILLIDDEQIVLDTIGAMIRSLGFDVLTALNGHQALDIVREKGSEISLLLMDAIMPEMGGEQCFYELKENGYSIPVILCSGYIDNLNINKLKSDGLAAYVTKPFSRGELSLVIAECLDHKVPTQNKENSLEEPYGP